MTPLFLVPSQLMSIASEDLATFELILETSGLGGYLSIASQPQAGSAVYRGRLTSRTFLPALQFLPPSDRLKRIPGLEPKHRQVFSPLGLPCQPPWAGGFFRSTTQPETAEKLGANVQGHIKENRAKRILMSCVILLWAAPVGAQTDLLPTLERLRNDYPTPMSHPQLAEYLNRVAWEHRSEGWGLLLKPGGNRCPAPQGLDIACDILVHAPTAQHFDVLIDAGGASIPTWRLVGPIDMARFLPPVRPAQARLTDGDFDGDSKADIAVYRPFERNWYILRSGSSTGAVYQWGDATDIPVPGDYDGDGRTDVAVFRPSQGNWFVVRSSNSTGALYQWGNSTDIPVPADYDGDSRTDLAVYRPSQRTWYILRSSTNYTSGAVYQWGDSTDVPIPADYDGDGRADIAVYRPSQGNWYILRSSNSTGALYQWGAPNDIPVPADYDGDAKADVAVFRPSEGNWYIVRSSNSMGVAFQWGDSTDIPVPADYDGDGRADVVVFRPSEGNWYIVRSSNSTGVLYQWGAPNDIPVLKAP